MNFEEIILKIDVTKEYCPNEVAEMLGRSASCILQNISRGEIPARKFLNRYYINGQRFRDYVVGQTTNGRTINKNNS